MFEAVTPMCSQDSTAASSFSARLRNSFKLFQLKMVSSINVGDPLGWKLGLGAMSVEVPQGKQPSPGTEGEVCFTDVVHTVMG